MIDGSVVVGWCSGGSPHAKFTRSLVNAVGWSVDRIAGHILVEGGPRIASLRNDMVTQFLKSDGEWLLMVDDDMTFEHDLIETLVKAADPEERPIVGGLCFGVRDNRIYPTLYGIPADAEPDNPHSNKPVLMHTPLTDGLIPVDATGAACLLIHRRVLEHMGVTWQKPYQWFTESVLGEWEVGEDITFCLRARSLGYPIYVHGGVNVGHIKPKVIDKNLYLSLSMLPDDQIEYVNLPKPDQKEAAGG